MGKTVFADASSICILPRTEVLVKRRRKWDGAANITERKSSEILQVDINELEEVWDNILRQIEQDRMYEKQNPMRYFKVGVRYDDKKGKIRIYYLIVDRSNLEAVGIEIWEEGKKPFLWMVCLDTVLKSDLKNLELTPDTLENALKDISVTWGKGKKGKYRAFRFLSFLLIDAAKAESIRAAVKICLSGRDILTLPGIFQANGRTEDEIKSDLMKCNNHTPVIRAWYDMAVGRYNRMLLWEEEKAYFCENGSEEKQRKKLLASGIIADVNPQQETPKE